jgi:hypothetical protein
MIEPMLLHIKKYTCCDQICNTNVHMLMTSILISFRNLYCEKHTQQVLQTDPMDLKPACVPN